MDRASETFSWLPHWMDTTLVLATATTLVITYYLVVRLSGRKSWEEYGVKSGTLGLDIVNDCSRLLADGVDTVGTHLDRKILITRDVDVIKAVTVKNFNSIQDRNSFLRTATNFDKGLFFLKGQEWKGLRHLMSPFFSTTRLKSMASNIDSCARKLTAFLEAQARESHLFEVKHTVGQYTTGIIAQTGFGFMTDCIGDETDNEFTRHCKGIMRGVGQDRVRMVRSMLMRFPRLLNFLLKTLGVDFLDFIEKRSYDYFSTILGPAIQERESKERSGGSKPVDFLQSLVSLKVASDDGHLANPISKEGIISQSVLIMFAGFETTATTMQLCLLNLAMHPHIQEKVYQEITEVVPATDDDTCPAPTHEQRQQLTYTQQVIDETLRLYPVVGFLSRLVLETTTLTSYDSRTTSSSSSTDKAHGERCNVGKEENKDFQGEEVTIPAGAGTLTPNASRTSSGSSSSDREVHSVNYNAGEDEGQKESKEKDKTDGNAECMDNRRGEITIPEGAGILIPIFMVHTDPRHYANPDKFDPEHFSKESRASRHPSAFLPFGLGPRQCIGMRLAYQEVKTALVHTLRKVRVELNEHTVPKVGEKPSIRYSNMIQIDKPIKLAVTLR